MRAAAGIDEAGYGPRLGPMVTSAVCVRLPEECAEPRGAVLWQVLEQAVARTGRGGRHRLRVGDSKAIYSPERGLAELERTVLAFAAAAGRPAGTPEELFEGLLSEACRRSVSELAWYADRSERLPLEAPAERLARDVAGLCGCCGGAGVGIVAMQSRLLAEREFNRRVGLTNNKAEVLLDMVAELLRELRGAAGEDDLEIEVDRLGGRTDYRPLLHRAFPGAAVREELHSAERQRYLVDGLSGPTRVEFRAKADRSSFPVALASMVSKYLREILMRRFNAFWKDVDSTLPSTSGYHADAIPFLEASAARRREMGVPDADLVRCR